MSAFSKKTILTALPILFCVSFAFAPSTLAADYPKEIKNWNDSPSQVASQNIKGSTGDEVCAALFNMDQKNIFKEAICAIINVAAISTSDFASNITCTIQNVAMGNYDSIIQATSANGQCTLKGSSGTENVFGESSNTTKTKFFNQESSQLSLDIIKDPATENSAWIGKAFAITRGIIIVLAVIALLAVAFANILHIDTNTYAIKKALPNLVIAIVLGYFSLTIVYLFSRFVDILYAAKFFSPYNSLNPMFNIFGGNFSSFATAAGATASGSTDSGSLLLVFKTGATLISSGSATLPSFITGLLGTLTLVISSSAVFAFEYIMALRPLAVGLLTVLAPFAFVSIILPQTQVIMKKWWSFMIIALFYPLIVNFTFYILNIITSSVSASSSGALFLVILLFKVTIMILLIRLPFTVEADFRRIALAISKTDFGSSLGIGKFVNNKEVGKGKSEIVSAAENNLKSTQAQNIIAGTANKFARVQQQQTSQAISKQLGSSDLFGRQKNNIDPGKILEAASSAFRANANRPADLMVKSTEDLSPGVFRKILTHSNLQIWKDGNIAEELKRKNGQVLDEQGAAIRADSARQLYRLAQIVDNNKIANPEAIKLLSSKGMLDILPLNIIQKALQEGLVNKTDLVANFKQNADEVLEKASQIKAGGISPATAQSQISADHKDYMTGFKDISRMFSDVVKDATVVPPPPPAVIKNIIDDMKTADTNVFEKNGMYFLQRLGEINRQSQSTIVSSLQKEGVNPQTATAIAQNPQLDIEDVKNYVPGGSASPQGLLSMREGFINRDLSNNLITNVAGMISENRIAVSKGVTEKLAEQLKSDETANLKSIKDTLNKSLQNIPNASPEQLKEIGQIIDKYHPGSMIKTDGEMSAQDVDKMKERGENVVDTIDSIEKQGVNDDKLKSNPTDVAKMVEDQISGAIQKALAGE